MTEQAMQLFSSNLAAQVFHCNLCYVTSFLQLCIIIIMGLILPAEGRFVEVC